MDLDELRRLFLFQSLTDVQLAELAALADEVPFVEDEVLFREGEPADCWWVLLDGRIDLVRRSEHEESVVGALERPGVWAGGFRAWAESAGYMATGRGGAALWVSHEPDEPLVTDLWRLSDGRLQRVDRTRAESGADLPVVAS